MIEIRNVSDEPVVLLARGERTTIDPGKAVELPGYLPLLDGKAGDVSSEMLFFAPVFSPAQRREPRNGIREDAPPKDLIR